MNSGQISLTLGRAIAFLDISLNDYMLLPKMKRLYCYRHTMPLLSLSSHKNRYAYFSYHYPISLCHMPDS